MNQPRLVAVEEQEETDTRRRLLAQARKGNQTAQLKLWQDYRVRVTPGRHVAPEVVARVRSWMAET